MNTEKQTTNVVVMVSPDYFEFNSQTAMSNAFQHEVNTSTTVGKQAIQEFAAMVAQLKDHDINVITLASPIGAPDAVFPNNWFSTHLDAHGRSLITYPMLTPNRRIERQVDNLKQALRRAQIAVQQDIDLTGYEHAAKFLEGTGSLILDRVNHIAYAALSPRTNKEVLLDFCTRMHYQPSSFTSCDEQGRAIYHTNVMLSIGTHFAVIVAESIVNAQEREAVLTQLAQTGKEVIELSFAQMHGMAANILELRSATGAAKIILSETAYSALSDEQRLRLSKHGDLVPVAIKTIETVGGGSARCMLAEVF
jgi:hypothetical protein